MSNYLPRVLDCRETSTLEQPKLHTGTNCGGFAVVRGSFTWFILLPMVTLGPLTAPETPGVVPAPRAKQAKADLSHL